MEKPNVEQPTSSQMSMLDPADEGAIRELLQRMINGWNSSDGDAFAASFSEDADYLTATGDHLQGRHEIATVHQDLFNGFFAGTRLGSNITNMRSVTSETVVVHSEGGVLFPGESEESVEYNGLVSYVITKHDGKWHIAAFQNTPVGQFRGIKFLTRYLVSRIRILRQ